LAGFVDRERSGLAAGCGWVCGEGGEEGDGHLEGL
jgi:hypothetical protein